MVRIESKEEKEKKDYRVSVKWRKKSMKRTNNPDGTRTQTRTHAL